MRIYTKTDIYRQVIDVGLYRIFDTRPLFDYCNIGEYLQLKSSSEDAVAAHNLSKLERVIPVPLLAEAVSKLRNCIIRIIFDLQQFIRMITS